MTKFVFLIISFLILSEFASAQGCDNYPYQSMENTIEFDGDGNFKIISTGASLISFDDPAEINSSKREAELIAKRFIAEYISQRFISEDTINTEIAKSKTAYRSTNGNEITNAQRDEVKKQLSLITTKTDTLLRGIVTIGSCYSKGNEIRVTVGLKSQTLQNAFDIDKKTQKNKDKSFDGGNKIKDF